MQAFFGDELDRARTARLAIARGVCFKAVCPAFIERNIGIPVCIGGCTDKLSRYPSPLMV